MKRIFNLVVKASKAAGSAHLNSATGSTQMSIAKVAAKEAHEFSGDRIDFTSFSHICQQRPVSVKATALTFKYNSIYKLMFQREHTWCALICNSTSSSKPNVPVNNWWRFNVENDSICSNKTSP